MKISKYRTYRIVALSLFLLVMVVLMGIVFGKSLFNIKADITNPNSIVTTATGSYQDSSGPSNTQTSNTLSIDTTLGGPHVVPGRKIVDTLTVPDSDTKPVTIPTPVPEPSSIPTTNPGASTNSDPSNTNTASNSSSQETSVAINTPSGSVTQSAPSSSSASTTTIKSPSVTPSVSITDKELPDTGNNSVWLTILTVLTILVSFRFYSLKNRQQLNSQFESKLGSPRVSLSQKNQKKKFDL